MKINKYPDGTSYAEIAKSMEDAKAESYFTYKINSYEDLWHLGQILEVFNHKDISPCITIPNLIDSQADRRFGKWDNQSSGLKLVCKFLNQFDAYYKIFHPHNPEVVEALFKNVTILDNYSFVLNAIRSIDRTYKHSSLNPENNLILMSSDAGGFKPLMKLCDQLNWQGETYSASKSRIYADGKSKLTQLIDREDFQGKDILIVDDICIYGGTFKGLSKLLKERNCGKLYLAVSHMTIQNLGDDPITNYFDKIFTTNSKYDKYHTTFNGQPINLEIIKIF